MIVGHTRRRCHGQIFQNQVTLLTDLAEDFNAKGYHYPVAENDPACVNCRLCEMLCPEFAIFCLEVKEESVDDS